MSRLDHLLHLVDAIDVKSNVLLQSFHDCSDIIDKISDNNSRISSVDVKINSNHQYVKSHYQFSTELYDLNARVSLFEHDLVHNDFFTNNNIYTNLMDEFNYLKQKYPHQPYLEHTYDYHTFEGSEPQTVSNKPSEQSLKIPKSISISNLSLKPIRTKANKVYKKKSHYKISNLFNNTILHSPVDVRSIEDNSEPFSDRAYHTNTSTDTIENFMDVTYPQSNDTTPELVLDPSTLDINSKPQMHDIEDFNDIDHNMDNIDIDNVDHNGMFPYEFNDNESTLSDSPSLEFENFESFLRKSRVSLAPDSFPFVVKKSVSDASINLEPASSSPLSHRIPGIDDIPQIDEVSKTQESLQQEREQQHQQQQVPTAVHFKFHNPIDNIKPKHETLSPTVQSVHSTFSNKIDNEDKPPSTSESLLAKVMGSTPVSSPNRPSESPFAFFNFINSPSKKDAGSTEPVRVNVKQDSVRASKSRTRSCSVSSSSSSKRIGTSLTESFLQLMHRDPSSLTQTLSLGGPPLLVQQQPQPAPVNSRRLKRNKLERLKSVPKTNPITVLNETQLKRLPHAKLASSASSLILDSNKSFVVHGDSTAFKRPFISNFSNRNLQEALCSSLT